MDLMNIEFSPCDDSDHILSLAAIFEGNFTLDWLIELTGCKAGQVLGVLEEGTQQGLLVKQPGGIFAFRDSSQLPDRRTCLPVEEKQYWHRRIAELLMKELPDDPKNMEKAARHLLYVQNDLDGCRWLLRAADTLQGEASYSKALCYYNKIFEDLSKTQGIEADKLFVETAIKYAEAHKTRDDTEKVAAIFQEATAKAQKWDLRRALSLIKMHFIYIAFLQSKYGDVKQHFEEGWELAKSIDDPKFIQSIIPFRTFSLYWQGRYKEAIRSYEASMPAIEKLPLGQPLFATCVIGYCYAMTGQFSQGLGLLDALRRHCLENDSLFMLDEIKSHMAAIMIELNRPDEALSFLDDYITVAADANSSLIIRAKLLLSYAYFLKGKRKEAVHHFSEALARRKALHISVVTNDFWFEMCKAMEEGKIPRLGGIRLEDEIKRYLGNENMMMKGIAYRYQAYLQEREGQSPERIIESLNLSAQCLEESGLIFERCRTCLALVRQHSLLGDEKAAQEMTTNITKILGSFSKIFVPNDLQGFISKIPTDWESLCDEILLLSQEMSTIRDQKRLLQVILSTANRITGAERGAIFSLKKDGNASQIQLKASKNISAAQVADQRFAPVKKMIKDVAASSKGRILKINSEDHSIRIGNEILLSQICVPMIIRNKVVGVLYHDNSLFVNSFKEADLKLLSYFATQAAIALDNAEAYTKIKDLNHRLNQEKQYYKEQFDRNLDFDDIIGKSQPMLQVLNKIRQVADTGTTVLILGETGVGKEMVAWALHRHSSRKNQPFIKVLCNALPESLISSEFFGHEKGAFTGSVQRRIGRFELADGGSIFLDEIGDLQLDIQTQLLQVLQSKKFERVGGSETIRSDFRLITATNRDLAEAVKSKKFRSDLYYRLNIFPIYVPPLRERKEDIPLLAYHFLRIYAGRIGKTFDGIPQDEMKKLMHYNWPGNIRELEGIIERGVVLSNGPYFQVPELYVGREERVDSGLDATLKEMERSHILQALQKTGWKVRGQGGAAQLLDINYSTLNYQMRKLGIVRPVEFARRGRR